MYKFDDIKWIIAEDSQNDLKIIPYYIYSDDFKIKDLLDNEYIDYNLSYKYECEPLLKKYNIESEYKTVSTDSYTIFCLALYGCKAKLYSFLNNCTQEETYNKLFKDKLLSNKKILEISKLAKKCYVNLDKSDLNNDNTNKK